uniref:Uncharacterized protein n=1 Tax=Aegilops tauschii TaxID=37682 RepID=M8BRL5_AEGTA
METCLPKIEIGENQSEEKQKEKRQLPTNTSTSLCKERFDKDKFNNQQKADAHMKPVKGADLVPRSEVVGSAPDYGATAGARGLVRAAALGREGGAGQGDTYLELGGFHGDGDADEEDADHGDGGVAAPVDGPAIGPARHAPHLLPEVAAARGVPAMVAAHLRRRCKRELRLLVKRIKVVNEMLMYFSNYLFNSHC